MQVEKIKNFNLIYDFRGPNDWIPNALNYYYSLKYFEKDFNADFELQNHFYKNFTQPSVFNCFLNSDHLLFNKITIRDYVSKKNKYKNDTCFYLVEPFGNFNHFLGKQFGGFSETDFIEFISKDSLHNIKNNDLFYLVINYGTEGVFAIDFFSNLYSLLEKHNIPEYKVILLSSAVDIKNLHKKIRNHNPKKIQTFYWPWSLRYKSQELKKIHSGDDYKFWDNIDQPNTIVSKEDLNIKKHRENKFLIMNRRLRPQRMILLCMLGVDFIKKNLVSYDIELFDRENDLDFYLHHAGNDIGKEIYKKSFDIIKHKKQTIDYDDINSVWGFNFENKKPYLQSYINVVNETNFYEDGLYLSEKTWKPIGHLQPFIQVNKAGALAELKNLGFKTFYPFINEDYDNEVDDKKRIRMIASEILRINKMSIKEIHKWYHSIEDILIHNQTLLFDFADKKQNIEREFVTNLKNYVVNKENQRLF